MMMVTWLSVGSPLCHLQATAFSRRRGAILSCYKEYTFFRGQYSRWSPKVQERQVRHFHCKRAEAPILVSIRTALQAF